MLAGLPINQVPDAKKALATELYHRFHSMKTYGKEPESLESIIAIFANDLADYPLEKIMMAIKTHSQRSSEFPTIADIVLLIRNNGRPLLKESDIIAIRKKDGEHRTRAEWAMLREWESQQSEAWQSTGSDSVVAVAENERLRKELAEAKKENSRLQEIMRLDDLRKNYIPPAPPKPQDKIQNTINAMKAQGYTDSDIEEFINSLTATGTSGEMFKKAGEL